ncbi:MAG: prolipoprotein diacylglyceryl transferase [Patescibacteria group bacterium]|nr:prolipoprotein diacylglyceryl transferase [Patescibacteria group bacterium]
MIDSYQHIPKLIDPVAFSIGSLSVHWYSLMWLAAFAATYFLLVWRIKKGEGSYDKNFIQDVTANALIGALIGGRLGYVIFYDLPYYLAHPLQIISPYDLVAGEWVGIYGMSYHGGVIGVVIALIWTARKKKKNILDLFDFIAPAASLGYMFGRIGNFFNAELVGRITQSPVGMYFNDDIFLRHPSQLYEAFFEGLILFVILWSLRNRGLPRGVMSALYLIGYSLARFGVEFFRAPDAHLGFIFSGITMGQILSFVMFGAGIVLLFLSYKWKKAKN